MPLNDEVRIRHLVEAASKAVSYTVGRSRADLDDDELLRLALTKLVEIVGEAAKHISDDLRESHSVVPWSAAARMRDRLVHHYFDINLDVLWSTVLTTFPGYWRFYRMISYLTDQIRRRVVKATSTSNSRVAYLVGGLASDGRCPVPPTYQVRPGRTDRSRQGGPRESRSVCACGAAKADAVTGKVLLRERHY